MTRYRSLNRLRDVRFLTLNVTLLDMASFVFFSLLVLFMEEFTLYAFLFLFCCGFPTFVISLGCSLSSERFFL